MKKFIFLIIVLLSTTHLKAQTADSLTTTSKTEILAVIKDDSMVSSDTVDMRKLVGRYKVYRTTNIYNNLKLDTATGEITALQIGLNNNESCFEYLICSALELDPNLQIVNRYELYPTGNSYNFILIDTIYGTSYQVQWSTKSSECGRWRIWKI